MTSASEKLGIEVNPYMLRDEFMPLLHQSEERTFAQLALGLGSKDVSKPRRVVEKYTEAAQIFGLAEVSSSGVRLTTQGLQFRGDFAASRGVVRGAFYGREPARQVLKTLSSTILVTRNEARRRLSPIGRDHELDLWLDWLLYAVIVTLDGEAMKFNRVSTRPLALYSAAEMDTINEERYRALAASGYISHSPVATLSYTAIVESRRNFRAVAPEKAEGELKRFVALALSFLGIITQVDDGPREKNNPAVNFGSEGEDAVGFFLRPPIAFGESLRGLVMPMELKRSASDKKAVGQAVTAAGRWRSYFNGQARVLPLTVSDSETYAEKSARDYAATNGVIHLSVDTLARIAEAQKSLFDSGRGLLNAVHLWTILEEFAEASYVEPTTEDVLQAIGKLGQSVDTLDERAS